MAHENPTRMMVRIAESACAAVVSTVGSLIYQHVAAVVATHEHLSEVRCADSESRILAMKKFSCPPASRLIAARQNRFFARIAATDSRHDFRSR